MSPHSVQKYLKGYIKQFFQKHFRNSVKLAADTFACLKKISPFVEPKVGFQEINYFSDRF